MLRLAVAGTNEIAIPFWERMGFQRTGEVKPYGETVVMLMEMERTASCPTTKLLSYAPVPFEIRTHYINCVPDRRNWLIPQSFREGHERRIWNSSQNLTDAVPISSICSLRPG
jgi:hypothetical protein